jgi:hypothetical protein
MIGLTLERVVVMRRAPYRPASAGFASAEGLAVMAHLLVIGGDGLAAGIAVLLQRGNSSFRIVNL